MHEEYYSVKANTDSLKAKCREAELEAQTAIESARGANAVAETRLRGNFNERLESVSSLQEVLTVENLELDARVRSLKSELLSVNGDADCHNDASTLSQVRATLFNVQSQLEAEQIKALRLASELAEATSQLRDWETQYDWQYQVDADPNDREHEENFPRLDILIWTEAVKTYLALLRRGHDPGHRDPQGRIFDIQLHRQ